MAVSIDSLQVRVVRVPFAEPIKHPFMGERTQYVIVLVQMRCSDGSEGLGYAAVENIKFAAAVQSILLGLEDVLRGKDPLRRAFLHDLMWNVTVDLLHDGAANIAMAALDMALWDICGKHAGLPVWRLLGGYRDKVPVYASGNLWRHHSTERLQADSVSLVEQGYRAMKLRMGGGRPHAEDVARARAVREAVGPDVEIMVDALWGCTPLEGVRLARALAELNFTWLEEPVREGDFAGLAQIKAENALPIAAGERISRLDMFDDLIPAIDHAIIDVSHLGGITQSVRAMALLDVRNLPISTHSYPLISMHVVAAARTGAWVEFMDWWHPVFKDAPVPVDGYLHLPEKPGLGLEIDEAYVAHNPVQ